MEQRKTGCISSSVILIVAFSKTFELGLVVGLSHHKLTHRYMETSPSEIMVRHWPSQFISSMGIQNSKG